MADQEVDKMVVRLQGDTSHYQKEMGKAVAVTAAGAAVLVKYNKQIEETLTSLGIAGKGAYEGIKKFAVEPAIIGGIKATAGETAALTAEVGLQALAFVEAIQLYKEGRDKLLEFNEECIKASGALTVTQKAQKAANEAVEESKKAWGDAAVEARNYTQMTLAQTKAAKDEITVQENLRDKAGELGAALGALTDDNLDAFFYEKPPDNWLLWFAKLVDMGPDLNKLSSQDSWAVTFAKLGDATGLTEGLAEVDVKKLKLKELNEGIVEATKNASQMFQELEEEGQNASKGGFQKKMDAYHKELYKPGGVAELTGANMGGINQATTANGPVGFQSAVAEELEDQYHQQLVINEAKKTQFDLQLRYNSAVSENHAILGDDLESENEKEQRLLMVKKMQEGLDWESARAAARELEKVQQIEAANKRIYEDRATDLANRKRAADQEQQQIDQLQGTLEKTKLAGMNPAQARKYKLSKALSEADKGPEANRESVKDALRVNDEQERMIPHNQAVKALLKEIGDVSRSSYSIQINELKKLNAEGEITDTELKQRIRLTDELYDATHRQAAADLEDEATKEKRRGGLTEEQKLLEDYVKTLKHVSNMTDSMKKAKTDAYYQSLLDAKASRDGKAVLEEYMTPLDKYNKKVTELFRMRKVNAIDDRTLKSALADAKRNLQDELTLKLKLQLDNKAVLKGSSEESELMAQTAAYVDANGLAPKETGGKRKRQTSAEIAKKLGIKPIRKGGRQVYGYRNKGERKISKGMHDALAEKEVKALDKQLGDPNASKGGFDIVENSKNLETLLNRIATATETFAERDPVELVAGNP